MRVLIDGRMYQGKMHGLARYIYCTLESMASLRPDWEFGVLDLGGHYSGLASRLGNVLPVPVKSPPFSLGEHLELANVINDFHAAVYHTPTLAVVGGVTCRRVATIPDLIVYHYGSWWKKYLYFKLLLQPILRSCQRYLVYSEHTVQDACQNLSLDPSRFIVCPLGVEPSFLESCSEAAITRLRKDLKLNNQYVLCVSNPKAHKNLKGLVSEWQKAKRLAKGHQEFFLAYDLVIVSAPEPTVDEAGRSDPSIKRISGVLEHDLTALYQGASMVVVPSLYEGFGLPVLEGMASRVPVLASNATSLPEVTGDAGALFDPTVSGDCAKKMLELLMDANWLESAIVKGYQRAQEFTWEKVAKLHLQAYLEAVQ